jgi:DNA-binding NarL/FixJ family response regulator
MTSVSVVIVEDEFLVALELEEILYERGYTVVATVPDFATACALENHADVALVDLNLRDGPTGQQIAQLFSDKFNSRIIYVTASSGQIQQPAQTAVGIIHKPFSEKSIADAVAYALDESTTKKRPIELQLFEEKMLYAVA